MSANLEVKACGTKQAVVLTISQNACTQKGDQPVKYGMSKMCPPLSIIIEGL